MALYGRGAEAKLKHRIRAAGILVDEQRRVLLALEEVTESGTEVWVPPGGGLEPDDASVVECLRREFLEETGLSIEVGALLYVREGPEAETDTHGIELYFAVHSPRGEVNHIERQHAPFGADKRRHVRWFTRADTTVACGQLVPKRDWAGLLIYDATGHMAAQLLPLDRPKFASGNRLQGTQEEIKAAFDGYFAYFGPYEVNEAEGVVIHHVKGSIFPNDVGRDNIRYYEFSGDRLILIPTNMVDGKLTPKSSATVRLTWERVK